jgi:hypothetical protein
MFGTSVLVERAWDRVAVAAAFSTTQRPAEPPAGARAFSGGFGALSLHPKIPFPATVVGREVRARLKPYSSLVQGSPTVLRRIVPSARSGLRESRTILSACAYFPGKYLLTLTLPSTAPSAALKMAVHVYVPALQIPSVVMAPASRTPELGRSTS